MGEPTLLLKFSGEGLDVRGVPVYELGDTLIALQRVIHKAYLFQHGRLGEGLPLRKAERQQLSLQIVDRERSSDLYVLAPFLADPMVQQMVFMAAEVGLAALLDYGLHRVLDSSQQPTQQSRVKTRDVSGSFFAGAIYAETVQITNHINNIGGVDSIHILPGGGTGLPPVRLDQETQSYVRYLANQTVYGPVQEIVGYVTRLHPNRLMADIKVGPGEFVRVHLDEEMFKYVRYGTEAEEYLRFTGAPVLRLGQTGETFNDFEAHSVTRE